MLRRAARRRSLNIALHGVSPPRPDMDPNSHWRSPERFRGDIELLRESGFQFVTVADLAKLAGGERLPPGYVTLSFDDGMQDNYAVALPILQDLGVPATVYVISGLIGQANPWFAAGSGTRMMTEDELRELHAAGIEIGAHTVSHPDLTELDYDACLAEMRESKEALERITGAPVETFAYPFCLWNETAREAAHDAGFLAAVSCGAKSAYHPYSMWRAMITGRDGTAIFVLKASGIFQPLWESLPGRAVRAVTRRLRRRLTRR